MSLWGEWKAGLITDSEYTRLCKEEELRDKAIEEAEWDEYLSQFDDEEYEEDEDVIEFF